MKGIGLMSMRDRVQVSLGTFACETEIGHGTRVVCDWNLKEFDPPAL